ncbi:MAG TPA: vWA domain-containing protein [Humisphaera sp.]|jgi:hypothetical protein|nr:vWA domain-containing protein [Humisphaera sp.]
MLSTIDQLLLLAQAVELHKTLRIDPAISAWLLAPGLLIAGAMILLLYQAQNRIAARRLVSILTGIRLALIGLTFVLLIRPLWVWRQTSNDPPTLWLLIDRSGSMAQKDVQSSPIERLRRANALELLPSKVHPESIDRTVANLTLLRDELQAIRAGTASFNAERGEKFKAWVSRLDVLGDSLSKSADLQDGIRTLAKTARSAADAASWQRVASSLDNLIARSQSAADDADNGYLLRSGSDDSIRAILADTSVPRRADLVIRTLSTPATIRNLLMAHRVRVVAFGADAKPVETELQEAIKAAAEPIESATDLAGALRYVSGQIGSDETDASLLIMSDGRANTGGDAADAARQLATRGVRVFTAAVGSRRLSPDAAIESLDAPDWVYRDDTVRIAAAIRLDALAGKSATVELRRGTELIDTQKISATTQQRLETLVFTDKPPSPDVYSYEVRILPVPGEAVLDNNSRAARVMVKNDKLEALVVDQQPRWEYRYLANYLKRDSRVHLQTILLDPAQVDRITPPAPMKASPTNPKEEAQILPQTPAEWSAFDLVVIGDVPPEFLTGEAQANLARAVRDRGTTLVTIAGPLNMPARFVGSALADILPIESSSNWSGSELSDHAHNGFAIVPAPEGAASILSQFAIDPATNAKLWSAIPAWYWHSPQTQAKPAASVLWRIAEQARSASNPKDKADLLASARKRALLATMPLGLGRVIYLASDSTWRLRDVAGENLHERFWGQMIRWVAGSDMPAGGKLVRFGVDKPRAIAGEAIHISARLLSNEFTPMAGEKVAAVVHSAGQDVARVQLEDSGETPGLYHAQLQNLPAGWYELSLEGTAIDRLMSADPTASRRPLAFDVIAPSTIERQNVNPDRAALARVASEGNGLAVDAEYLDLLADYVPRTPHEQTVTRQLGLFADPNDRFTRAAHWGFLALFVALITAEWVLRKIGGLV